MIKPNTIFLILLFFFLIFTGVHILRGVHVCPTVDEINFSDEQYIEEMDMNFTIACNASEIPENDTFVEEREGNKHGAKPVGSCG